METKLGASANPDQLRRHCRTIVDRLPGRKGSFLISLTSGQGGQTMPAEVTAMANENGVTLVQTTFGELVAQVTTLPVNDLALSETLQEFADFIFAQGLVPREEQIMVAMLTGTSWQDNLVHRVYYEPVDRSPKWRRAAFLGLYHHKQVSHVGRIICAVSAMQDETGQIAFGLPETGVIDEAGKQAIRDVIEAAQGYYPGLEGSPHRYYVVDALTAMDFRKTSPGGMMGHRYFDLEDISGSMLAAGSTGVQAAQALDGHGFV